MCRSTTEGGRRCPGSGRVSAGHGGDTPSRDAHLTDAEWEARMHELGAQYGYEVTVGLGGVAPSDSELEKAADMMGLTGKAREEAIARGKANAAARPGSYSHPGFPQDRADRR